jgi:branched-chain amino acid transport system substrate-binding protein
VRPDLSWFSRNALAKSAVAVLGVSVLAACTSASGSSGGTTSSGNSQAPITIGASLSLTGDFSADGQAFDRGYTLWAKDVNADGGILGRKVVLKILTAVTLMLVAYVSARVAPDPEPVLIWSR